MLHPIIVKGRPGGADKRGYPLPAGKDRLIPVRRVEPMSLSDAQAMDYQITTDALKIFAPAGHDVKPGDFLEIAGDLFEVTKTIWDYSAFRHRTPVNPAHRPSTVIICERGGAFG